MAVYDNGHSEIGNNMSRIGAMNHSWLYAMANHSLVGGVGDFLELDVTFHRLLYKTVVPALFGVIIVVGLVGNCMVVGVIVSKRKMRTTVNLLLLNLALSDLTFLTVCVPFVAYHYAADNWDMGGIMCKLSQFLLYVTVYVTVYTLILIAAVRYFTIVYSSSSARLRTKRNICMAIGAIWAIMLVANVPILLVYRVKRFPNPGLADPSDDEAVYKYCGMETKETGQLLFLTFFILTYMLPLVIITTFYFLIMRFLHSSRNNSLRSTIASTSSMSSSSSSRRASSRSVGCSERKSHATRIVMSVCLVFGLCWLPLHAHLLVVYFGTQPVQRLYEIFRVLCHCLAYANSSMNPIIYNYVSKDFRKSFRQLLATCTCPKNRLQILRPPTSSRYEPDTADARSRLRLSSVAREGSLL